MLRALRPIRLDCVVGRCLGTESHCMVLRAGILRSECRNEPTATHMQRGCASEAGVGSFKISYAIWIAAMLTEIIDNVNC